MVRATEVIVVFGFLQPSALAGGFAGLAAWRSRTVALTPHVAMVGIKEDLAVLTRALSAVTCHWPESPRSEEHTSELQSPCNLVCRLLLEKKKKRCGLCVVGNLR